jgi:hypothetical protein
MRTLSTAMTDALVFVAEYGSVSYVTKANTLIAALNHGYLTSRNGSAYYLVWLASKEVQLTADGWTALVRAVPDEVAEVIERTYRIAIEDEFGPAALAAYLNTDASTD